MKKRSNNKKEVSRTKLKKTKTSTVGRRSNQKVPDPWKEIRLKLKPIGKAYTKFIEKRKVAKQKEEQRRLKAEEEQRRNEEMSLKSQREEERILKKRKKLKEQEEKKLKAQEKLRLEEKRIKEEREDKIRQEQLYKERLIKAEQERKKQLERVSKIREEEEKFREEMSLKIGVRFDQEQQLRNEEQRLKNEEDKLKDREKILKEKEKNLEEKQRVKVEVKKTKENKRLNGTVKWFNASKGYGFIRRKGEEKDIFVHSTAIRNSGLEYLKEGEQLTFELEFSDKGPSAINLQKIVNEVSRSYLKVIK